MIWSWDSLRDLSTLSVAFRFLLAFIFGGTIGLDRGWRQQPAGLRTHLLVCIGATSTMLVSEYSYQYFHIGDPMRLSAQVISGIGFLGAGTILVTRRQQVKGLTTAASLWATACMGLAIGIGFYECALAMYILLLVVLVFVSRFDEKYIKLPNSISIFIEMRRDVSVGGVIQHLKKSGWDVRDLQEIRSSNLDILAIKVDLVSERISKEYQKDLRHLEKQEGILCVEEL